VDDMTATVGGGVESLRSALAGVLFTPEEPGYDEARKVWNADIDRRPALVVRCLSGDDVARVITFARETGLDVTVRAGAHSVPGHSVADGAVMIDLSAMRDVTVDPTTRRARVQGGALISDLDAATQAHGLAVPMGAVGHTGVAGLTLGGGMGWLSRRAGLSIDNLTSAQVVLADGSIVHTDAGNHPDLFWAIRGGGGNFGVVVEFEFALHPVGPMVDFALLFWPVEQATDSLRLIREVVDDLPESLNVILAILNAPPAPFVPEQHHWQPGYALLLTGFDDSEGHAAVVERIRSALPPLFDMVTPMPYVDLQQMFDEANAWGRHYYDKGLFLEGLTDEVIDVLSTHGPQRASVLSVMLMYHLGGTFCRVGEDDTAFSGSRQPQYFGFFVAATPTQDALSADREWVRAIHDALMPHSPTGTYVNALTEPDQDRVRGAYGHKYERLARIKARYDPLNVFRHNANIVPA
jgi:FAD/FMN-containing dehydrogenase